jgi:hypothetical protein
MADDLFDERIKKKARPDPERVRKRRDSLEREQPVLDDKEAAAERLLEESDSRTQTDPAPRDLREDRVERRTSDDATPPADEP